MIIIPSYQRFEKLKLNTLAYLKMHGILDEEICVVISEHDEQLDQYLSLPCGVLVTSANKIGQVHNFITETFQEGEFIIELDDDIRDIKDKDLESIGDFRFLMDAARSLMIKHDCSYCGTYAVNNKMFMNKSNEITTDLCYCLGLIRFRFIRKEIELKTDYSEDFENCIRHYIRDGKIVRMNHVVGITSNYSSGGCCGSGRDNDTEREHKERLMAMFPDYVRLFVRKNGKTDIRLKDRSKKKKVIDDIHN